MITPETIISNANRWLRYSIIGGAVGLLASVPVLALVAFTVPMPLQVSFLLGMAAGAAFTFAGMEVGGRIAERTET